MNADTCLLQTSQGPGSSLSEELNDICLQLILLLDCCIVLSELPLYLALLTHRFVISTRKVKVVTYFCMAWSAVVRLAEAVVLIAYFAGTLARMRRYAHFMPAKIPTCG